MLPTVSVPPVTATVNESVAPPLQPTSMPPGVVLVLVSLMVTVPPPLNKPTCVDVCGGTPPAPPVQSVVFHGTDDPVLSVM